MITPLDLRGGFPTVRRAFSDTDTRVFITALSFLCQDNEVRQWRKRDERLYLANKQGNSLNSPFPGTLQGSTDTGTC